MATKKSESEQLADLRAQIALLERQLEEERLKREAYQLMVKIAEEEFNIPIEKVWCQTAQKMKDLHPRIPLSRLCGLFDKSRQAFTKGNRSYMHRRWKKNLC